MGFLSQDCIDSWTIWEADMYINLDKFIENPTEEYHDLVAAAVRENCKRMLTPSSSRPCIAICKDNRKRDALAIMGNSQKEGWSRTMNTWKCSKHTPMHMRGMWVRRPFSNSLYINNTDKFTDTHEIYELPQDIYEALLTQFKFK